MGAFPLDRPSEYGIINLDVFVAPVSFQAPATKKALLVSAIRDIVSPCRYLLSGDVKLVIQWHVSERARYESDTSADVDNIVKPILDALSGPEGIMVDDCQVQELTCYWSDLYYGDEHFSIELRFSAEDFITKDGLFFLHVKNGLYFPLHDNVPAEALLRLAEHITWRFQEIERFIALGVDPVEAQMSRPIQRVFHKSKISGFRTADLAEIKNRIVSVS